MRRSLAFGCGVVASRRACIEATVSGGRRRDPLGDPVRQRGLLRRQAGGVDHHAGMRQAGELRQVLRLVPDQPEQRRTAGARGRCTAPPACRAPAPTGRPPTLRARRPCAAASSPAPPAGHAGAAPNGVIAMPAQQQPDGARVRRRGDSSPPSTSGRSSGPLSHIGSSRRIAPPFSPDPRPVITSTQRTPSAWAATRKPCSGVERPLRRAAVQVERARGRQLAGAQPVPARLVEAVRLVAHRDRRGAGPRRRQRFRHDLGGGSLALAAAGGGSGGGGAGGGAGGGSGAPRPASGSTGAHSTAQSVRSVSVSALRRGADTSGRVGQASAAGSSSTSTTCRRRGPCAPSSSVCSMSAERDGPVTSITLRGMNPPVGRPVLGTQPVPGVLVGADDPRRAQHHDRGVGEQVERGRAFRGGWAASACRSPRRRRSRAARSPGRPPRRGLPGSAAAAGRTRGSPAARGAAPSPAGWAGSAAPGSPRRRRARRAASGTRATVPNSFSTLWTSSATCSGRGTWLRAGIRCRGCRGQARAQGHRLVRPAARRGAARAGSRRARPRWLMRGSVPLLRA